jgi:hypothetical protein
VWRSAVDLVAPAGGSTKGHVGAHVLWHGAFDCLFAYYMRAAIGGATIYLYLQHLTSCPRQVVLASLRAAEGWVGCCA